MAIPKVGEETIKRALNEFDNSLRTSPDWLKWEENKSQAWVLVNGGKRYPPKKIVSIATGAPVSSFAGGPETNDYLAERGFSVMRLREITIRDTLRLIAERYSSAKNTIPFAGHHEIRELFTQARKYFTQAKCVQSNAHLRVDSSYGKGNWASIPWIAFLDDRETRSTQSGTYAVYLFKEDGKGFYLKLAQGVTAAEKEYGARAADMLNVRAEHVRQHCSALASHGFDLSGNSDLATTSRLGRLYEASTIASKYYDVENLPTDEELLADLDILLHSYDYYVIETRGKSATTLKDDRPISLIGASESLLEQANRINEFISKRGGWASWWSFPIKEEARDRLTVPFYLYTYRKGNLSARLRVDDYSTARGNDGITSPWPAQTDNGLVGISKAGAKQSEVCKTWFKVGSIEVLAEPLLIEDLEIAPGLSTPANVVNQNSFGYVIALESPKVDATNEVKSPVPEPLPIEWLEAHTGLSNHFVQSLVDAITGTSPQIILAGPPGTSKTWLARQLALYLSRNRSEQVRFVQFHQSYSYESFIEGLRPINNGNAVGFELRPGVVLDVVRQMQDVGAIDAVGDEFVIIIDEANRANLPRVLGELMFLFEYRGESVSLRWILTRGLHRILTRLSVCWPD